MIRALLAICLLAAAAFAGDSPLPHQGTVVLAQRSFANVWIFAETLDGVEHTIDSKRDGPKTKTPRGSYVRIDYAKPEEVGWLRGEALAGKPDWAAAGAEFMTATRARTSWYVQEDAFIRAAEAFVLANKPDDALKAIDGFAAAFPKSVRQARPAYLRGQALQLKGDAAGATKAFAELAKRAEWGIDAVALGALGQANLLTKEQKHDEAAKALAAVFAKLDADRDRELFGQIGIALAASQEAAKQDAAAIATLRRLAYGAADGGSRARAHLGWAKLLLAGGDANLFEAFDHAAIAMLMRDAGDAADQAGKLARDISARIDKLPEAQASSQLKAEYRRYLAR